jgi:hypothetical protein
MASGANYTLTYSGLVDMFGNRMSSPISTTFGAPMPPRPFVPWDDPTPPGVSQVSPRSPTEIDVSFTKAIAPSSATAQHFQIRARAEGSAPTIASATLQAGARHVILTTSPQTIMAPYTLVATAIADTAMPPHVLATQSVDFNGFGDTTPPRLTFVQPISPTEIALRFDKDLDALSASDPASYQIQGLPVTGVEFSGRPENVAAAFSPDLTTFVRSIAVLHTATMAPGAAYRVAAPGVRDLSGNTSMGDLAYTGPAGPVTVDVELSYLVSQSATVAGEVPPRLLSPTRLAMEREGIFIRGATVSLDGTMIGVGDPVTMQLDGFPPDGSPLDGPEPQLLPGPQPNTYVLRIRDVPLGTTIEWKIFASYTVAWKESHPNDPAAQFADPIPGPSAYQDGQEYPGNENAARILGQPDNSGVVHLRNLFGDEITYKKLTNHPAFVWVVGDWSWRD